MKSYEIPTKTTPNHCDGSPKMCPFKEMPTLTPVLRVEVNGMSGMAGWVKKKVAIFESTGIYWDFQTQLSPNHIISYSRYSHEKHIIIVCPLYHHSFQQISFRCAETSAVVQDVIASATQCYTQS